MTLALQDPKFSLGSQSRKQTPALRQKRTQTLFWSPAPGSAVAKLNLDRVESTSF